MLVRALFPWLPEMPPPPPMPEDADAYFDEAGDMPPLPPVAAGYAPQGPGVSLGDALPAPQGDQRFTPKKKSL